MSRSESLVDVLIVLGVCSAYVLLEALQVPKRWTLLAMGLALAGYAVFFARRRSDSWRDLGFRGDNLRAGLLATALVTVAGAAGIVAVGAWQGRTAFDPQSLLLLALYPPWALAQQLAFQGVLHRRLNSLVRSAVLPVVVTAAAFASVHAGNGTLVLLTFVAGIAWSLLYRQWPNLWLLAGSHAILAALAYPLVLADAPLTRL